MDPYIGEIRIFAGSYAPLGWLLCQGQLLSINDYQTLFTIVGTTYGGNGATTFAIPNLSGRAAIGMGGSAVLGQITGSETTTITTANMPAHTHAVTGKLKATSTTGDQADPTGKYWAPTATSEYTATSDPSTYMAPDAAAITLGVNAGGVSAPVNNMQPFLALNYIIATEGIYPAQ